jgi:hypothetical protein
MTRLEITEKARQFMLKRARDYTVYQAYCGG